MSSTLRPGHIATLTEHAQPPPAGLIPLTRNEIARLAAALIIQPVRDARYRLRWSTWRRRHQHTARTCHYQRQAAPRSMTITIYGMAVPGAGQPPHRAQPAGWGGLLI
jgi:hypothetical protein